MKKTLPLSLIAALGENRVIGVDNSMPWHLPGDFKYFKATTLGKPIIMGRKTFESLPGGALPGRTNIVITRNKDWHADGATRAESLEQALVQAGEVPDIWVIGGAQIYAQAEPLAVRAEVTEIAQDFEGDAYAPTLGPAWRETARTMHVSAKGLTFSFVTLTRT
jgi:dihydrofolate reductase